MAALCPSRDSVQFPGVNRPRSLMATHVAIKRRIVWKFIKIQIAAFICPPAFVPSHKVVHCSTAGLHITTTAAYS